MDPKLEKKFAKYGVVFKPGSESGFVATFKTAVEEGVIERRDPPQIVAVQNLHMEKDGTKYDLLVFKLKGSFGFGMCGNVTDGFLVIEGLNRRAYLLPTFIPDGGYIGEKFNGGNRLSTKDIENVLLLMRIALTGEKTEDEKLEELYETGRMETEEEERQRKGGSD
jgi:hypothetical protein